MPAKTNDRIHGMIALFTLGFCLQACDAPRNTPAVDTPPGTEPATPSAAAPWNVANETPETQAAGTVNFYWTELDENHNVVVRSEVVTLEQKAEMLSAREASRLAYDDSSNGAVEVKRSAAVYTSHYWSQCADYKTWLFYSGYNSTGDFFCAWSNGVSSFSRVGALTFVPRTADFSLTDDAFLCKGTTSCSQGCGPQWGSNVAMELFHQKHPLVYNLTPDLPSSVTFISIGANMYDLCIY